MPQSPRSTRQHARNRPSRPRPGPLVGPPFRALAAAWSLLQALRGPLACLAVLLITPPAAAQPALAPTHITIDGTGVSIRLPEGSAAQSSAFGSAGAARIALPDRLGELAIQSRRTSDLALNAADVAGGIFRQLTAAGGMTLVPLEAITIGGQPAHRFYVRTTGERPDVVGYTVVVPEPGRVITFELLTPVPVFEQVRALYEASLATVTLRDPQAVATQLAAAVAAGERFLESLSPEDYRQAVEHFSERWERLYAPDPNGVDTEHGYRRIRAWAGVKGELQPDKDAARYTPDEQSPGWMLRVDARLLNDGYIIDTEALYFLSPDRDDEAWTVRMAIKRGNNISRWIETGARSGRSITVQTDEPGGGTRISRPTIDGAAYLSTLETYLLPTLLASVGAPTEYAFVSYQTQSGQTRLRTDALAPSTDASGWSLTTTVADGDAQQVSRLDRLGVPRQTTLPDGRVWAPTSFDALLRLWRSKNLPLD